MRLIDHRVTRVCSFFAQGERSRASHSSEDPHKIQVLLVPPPRWALLWGTLLVAGQGNALKRSDFARQKRGRIDRRTSETELLAVF